MKLPGKSEDDETNQSCSTNVDNNREHESLSNCQDTNSVREIVTEDPKTAVEENPPPNKRLKFPATESHLNWQNIPEPVDRVCEQRSNPSNPVKSDDRSPSSVIGSSIFPLVDAISGMPVKVFEDPNQLDEVPLPASESCLPKAESCLPKEVVLTMNIDSAPTSMDFHPYWRLILLVGTANGTIKIYLVAAASYEEFCSAPYKELFSKNFRVRRVHSTKFMKAIENDMRISVNKVIWNSEGEGLMFGVAFSKNIVQLYIIHRSSSRNGERALGIYQHLEIEAHDGGVNDMAFYLDGRQQLFITCGDDTAVKVWDARTGEKLNTLRAHSAPICSICTNQGKVPVGNVEIYVPVIISNSIDGEIKEQLYHHMAEVVDYDTIGYGYTKFAYSTDNKRLFSCGVINEGEPFLTEWDDSIGNIIRAYRGLKAPSSSKIQFDTTLNRYLAAGDEHMIKYWDMDNVQLLGSTKADGELLASPCLCFNRDGILLAVAARENKIKILATDYDDFWNIVKISEPSQCQFLQLPVHQGVNKIVRLIYTNAGKGILALTPDGKNIVWKWPGNEQATSDDCPCLWKPQGGLQFMTNDLKNVRPEESIGCFAISKNGFNLISTSGGSISLFNMETFKTINTFLSPPPKATCISFYPRDDDVVAVGFDDSSILIYNIHIDKVVEKLRGRSTIVTSLAFSDTLHVLVHAECDHTIYSWDVEEWKQMKGATVKMTVETKPESLFSTLIQFHPDQINFLVVQISDLAIYEAKDLTLVEEWASLPALPISQADFSSDGTEIYAGFLDGTIKIFDGLNLKPFCRVDPTAYIPLPPTLSNREYLVALAANPVKAGQFAVGLSDGKVYVMEPPNAGLKWSTLVRDDNNEAAGTSGVGDAN
ncbi:hypothetical protein QN277_015234 [Acacia crassicarpa]|uniref:Uncharacterized protein n=1 Tax=Acacia crassicarpa TaxID=499986 RepID=A0AAE1MVD2_9FABA|nr:hypothetical protein QN277_015234 [Acacia crassicarpa]